MTKTARQLQEEGLLYDVFEQELTDIKDRTYGLVSELSRVSHFDMEFVMSLVRKIVAKIGQDSYIVPPFRCDYGDHVFIGNNTYINYNCCFLDSAKVTIGDYVYMGPNCNIFTPCHPIHHELRKEKVTEYALPVTVGSHSWIGGDVVITPGVTIGENCVIGAGSVVTKDIPDNSIAVGNPCKVIRQINDKDREYINSLILDDETKDSKYKQEHGYIYSAKDEAIFNIVKDTVHYVEILNKLSNSEIQRRRDFLRTFVAKLDEGAMINSPFYMEFANHLEMGVNSFINYDCIMLNNAMVKLGDNVLVGPKVSFYTAMHPIDAKQREQWLVYAKPITVEDNVWIGGSATILGGVTIGKNAIVGAGAVVTKDVEPNTIVVGNPARVLRKITAEDSKKYQEELAKQKDINKSEFDKMMAGQWYNAMDYSMLKLRQENNKKTEAYSRITINTLSYKDRMAKAIVKEFGENANIIPPFTCDYGCNVKVGDNTVINHSGVFLDTNEINIGKHALIGPKSGLYGAIHPFDVEARNEGIEKAKTINIGDGAWLGGKVTVVPGVSIGKHSVIGAGSVVTKDIPDDVVAVGNPCRVIRKITEDDKINPIRKK
ncbi:Galactoside O-acetyltransferase [Megamonas hypermegale]|uniref:Galactoside O-acetyltransferase n=4 Tax=Selenomonadaceae TaxID=1843491 RepID=A0A378NQ12_9FIRM|nr:sugar O-acetyltransferase [Megamonas hypermegale]STY69956.1 Galactoside O-acetyltransferase [Megamonas hypermegale]